ncbi:hypothetical protein J6590_101952, partial [Homalodisca vitripennis]
MGADHRLERHTRPRQTSRQMVQLTVKMTTISLMRKIKIPIKSSIQAKLHPISKCERSTRHRQAQSASGPDQSQLTVRVKEGTVLGET